MGSSTTLKEFIYNNSHLKVSLPSRDSKDDVGIEVEDFDQRLRSLWAEAMGKGLFRYKLDLPLPAKVLEGKYRFILQLNPERAQKRRKPQEIKSVNQPFNLEEFNFNKVPDKEIILKLNPSSWKKNDDEKEEEHLLLINVSPLEFGHVLLTPFRTNNAPQRVSYGGLRLAVELLLLNKDSNFRVGFNSLCGYASVNHEHYHAYYLNHRLYLESAKISPIITESFYELVDYPGKGFVCILTDLGKMERFLGDVIKLTDYLQINEIAHNIFVTRGSTLCKEGHFDSIRLYIWARESSYGSKQCDAFNPALCELGGHFPCKNQQAYDTLTEDFIIQLLGDICTLNFQRVRSAILEGSL